MKPKSTLQVTLTPREGKIQEFFPLFQRGVGIRVQVGSTVREMLCVHLGLAPAYVEGRIQTVFLEGKAVDDLDREVLRDGSALALSAAMPGLAGAILRKKGPLGALRSPVPPKELNRSILSGEGIVILKVFNLLLEELVPLLLKQGVWLKWEDWEEWIHRRSPEFFRGLSGATLDGQEIPPPSLMDTGRLRKTEWTFLTASFAAHS